MLTYFHIGPIEIPCYGTMVALGFVLPALASWPILKKKKLDIDDLLIIEVYALLGALLFGKLLFMITVWNRIQWSWIFASLANFRAFLGSGFVFYGGLIGGALSLFIPRYCHKIDVKTYLKHIIAPMVPFGHALGRIGCFLGGCCYGMEYDGPFAVVYPEGSAAPAGVSLFPSQLAEAFCLVIIGLINTFVIRRIKDARYTVPFYLITYGIVRFILEFFRGDVDRGHLGALSTSQWIAIGWVVLTIIVMIVLDIIKKRKENKKEAVAE